MRADLSGMVFGKLTVLGSPKLIGRHWHWLCRCECGTTCYKRGNRLTTGVTKSCGCYKGQATRLHLLGQKFNRLLVVGQVRKNDKWYWVCQCDCGNISEVVGNKLTTGATKSCGCWIAETLGSIATTHGYCVNREEVPEYKSWTEARQRCMNPDHPAYKDYGGRGIRFCEKWNDFALFLQDMGPKPSRRHSIDRINNEGNYEPGNCRWATYTEQNRNRRSSIPTYGYPTIIDFAESLGVKYHTLYKWLVLDGRSYEEIMTRAQRYQQRKAA
jgi:hypothetical protein